MLCQTDSLGRELTPVLPTFLISLHLIAASLTNILKAAVYFGEILLLPRRIYIVMTDRELSAARYFFIAFVLLLFPTTTHSGRKCSHDDCHYRYSSLRFSAALSIPLFGVLDTFLRFYNSQFSLLS